MSNDLLVRTALERRNAFVNLPKYLQTIKETVQKLDSKAEVYLFGSVAEGESNYSSDIDILIITNVYPAKIHAELWEAGIKEPFEIHIHNRKEAEFFTRRATLKKI